MTLYHCWFEDSETAGDVHEQRVSVQSEAGFGPNTGEEGVGLDAGGKGAGKGKGKNGTKGKGGGKGSKGNGKDANQEPREKKEKKEKTPQQLAKTVP